VIWDSVAADNCVYAPGTVCTSGWEGGECCGRSNLELEKLVPLQVTKFEETNISGLLWCTPEIISQHTAADNATRADIISRAGSLFLSLIRQKLLKLTYLTIDLR